MKPRLVFVHGVGGPRVPEAELRAWSEALTEGARVAGHSRRAARLLGTGGVDARFAYYGDLFTEPHAQGAPADLPAADPLAELLLEVVDTRLAEAHTVTPHEARVLRRARGQLLPEGEPQGAGSVGRRALNAGNSLLALPGLRRFGGWASARMMVSQLDQVRRYLDRAEADADVPSLDLRIRARVRRELDAEGPTVVVAHSLGTVVAVEALLEHAGVVPLLVTLGSPIGMRTAVRSRMRPQPPRVPATVGRWLNFWDRDDIIVGRPRIEDAVAANAASVRPETRRVDSDGLWVHPAATYLATPGVAGPVIEALEAAG
ncbi:alpha/beta hydrolase [Streptomyces profundus]|uniref:alpha/beta hydrolase n=1 Tax=Streptomyces profundus TaxID=2867410 RepID=UPI001D1659BB|nr:alpha/beta hydrolase [Streptomyces sp. MA3_2.13]UED86766.1 alpha/beta hydrolase [Streptomyces sp. MA3_2.13]